MEREIERDLPPLPEVGFWRERKVPGDKEVNTHGKED